MRQHCAGLLQVLNPYPNSRPNPDRRPTAGAGDFVEWHVGMIEDPIEPASVLNQLALTHNRHGDTTGMGTSRVRRQDHLTSMSVGSTGPSTRIRPWGSICRATLRDMGSSTPSPDTTPAKKTIALKGKQRGCPVVGSR